MNSTATNRLRLRIVPPPAFKATGQDCVQSAYGPLQGLFTLNELETLMGARSELDPRNALATGLLPSLQRYVRSIGPDAVDATAPLMRKVEGLNSAQAAHVIGAVEMALCSSGTRNEGDFFRAALLAPAEYGP